MSTETWSDDSINMHSGWFQGDAAAERVPQTDNLSLRNAVTLIKACGRTFSAPFRPNIWCSVASHQSTHAFEVEADSEAKKAAIHKNGS